MVLGQYCFAYILGSIFYTVYEEKVPKLYSLESFLFWSWFHVWNVYMLYFWFQMINKD